MPYCRIVSGTLCWGAERDQWGQQLSKIAQAEAILPREDALLYEESCMLVTKLLMLEHLMYSTMVPRKFCCARPVYSTFIEAQKTHCRRLSEASIKPR